MKKKLYKFYLLLFVPLFFLSSLTKGAEHVDLQILAYAETLKSFQTEAQNLITEWDSTKEEEKVAFLEKCTSSITRLDTETDNLIDNVCEELDIKRPYSKMSRDDINGTLRIRQITHLKTGCSYTPWIKLPCLDDQIWAHKFWYSIACDSCFGYCMWRASMLSIGIYPALMGVIALKLYIAQGLSLFVTLPCRARCSCPETEIKKEYNGPLKIRLQDLVSKINIILKLIEEASKSKNEPLQEAQVVTLGAEVAATRTEVLSSQTKEET